LLNESLVWKHNSSFFLEQRYRFVRAHFLRVHEVGCDDGCASGHSSLAVH
jgi:hypothetical protein